MHPTTPTRCFAVLPKIGLTVLAFCLVFACPAALLAQYTVSGSKITNAGAEFIVKGTNIEGYRSYYYRDSSNDANAVKAWGFNSVRIRCYIGNPHPQFGQQYNTSKPWLYTMIDRFRAAGIVVIVSVHDQTGGYFNATSIPTLGELISFHVDLANRYKTDTGVWLNITNEPGNNDAPYYEAVDPQWETMHNAVVTAIRNTGNNSIIMVDGHLWGQDAGGWDTANVAEWRSAILSKGQAVLNNDPLKNIVFSNHFYDQWEFGGAARIRDYLTRVAAKGLCLVVGEYGSITNKNAAGAYVAAGRYGPLTTDVLTVTTALNVGRMVWAWDTGDAWDLTDYLSPDNYTFDGGGWQINRLDGTKPTNLSWLGEQVWNNNRAAPAPTNNATTNFVPNPGLESGQLSPWFSWIPATPLAIVSDLPSTGTRSLRVLGDSGGQLSFSGLVAGKTYTLAASGRLLTADGSTLSVTVRGEGLDQSLVFTSNAFTRQTLIFTAPANLSWTQIQVWKTPGSSGYLDDFSLTETTNLVPNPGFESGQVSPWSSWFPSLSLAAVTGTPNTGTYSLRIWGNSGGQLSLTGFIPGKTYTLAASGRLLNADGSTLNVTVSGNGFSQSLAFTTNTYARKTLTFTAPANLTWMQIQVWKNPGSTGYVDDISVQ